MAFEIGNIFSDIGRAFEDLGHAIENTAKDIGRGLERAVSEFFSSNTVQQFNEGVSRVATEASTRVLGHTSGNPALPPQSQAVYGQVDGQLFARGIGDARDIDINDVKQGAVGDCYFMSSLAALAKSNPEAVRNMIRDNGDGTYVVTLHQRRLPWEPGSGEFKPVRITISGELPLRNGSATFAAFGDADGQKQELWAALIEKAYATYRGGYGISEGGWPANAMETLTGKSSTSKPANTVSISELERHVRRGDAVAATTLLDFKFDDAHEIPDLSDSNPLISNHTLVASHAYTVVGVDVAANTVTVRNPWGGPSALVTLSYEDFQTSMSEVAWNPGR